jgi:HEAT repeat protein
VQDQIARVLGRIGPAAAEAVPVLTEMLDNPSPEVRIEAATALWRITGDPGRAIPVLAEIVRNRRMLPELYSENNFRVEFWRWHRRCEAARRLTETGDPRAVPALTEAVLSRAGIVSPDGFLPGPRLMLPVAAAGGLARFGAAAKPAVANLVRRLSDPDVPAEVRRACAEALSAVGPAVAESPDAVAALRVAVVSDDYRLRVAARRALDRLGIARADEPTFDEARAALLTMLRGDSILPAEAPDRERLEHLLRTERLKDLERATEPWAFPPSDELNANGWFIHPKKRTFATVFSRGAEKLIPEGRFVGDRDGRWMASVDKVRRMFACGR